MAATLTDPPPTESQAEPESSGAQWVKWAKADWIAFAVLALVVIGTLPFLVHSWSDWTIDSSVYVVTARALAAGEGYTYLGEQFSIRPPGFPALIAPLVAGSEIDFFALNLLVSTFGAACILLLFIYLRPRLGWVLALGCALVVWSLPGFQRLCNQIMSDVPGAALFMLCLVAERWSSRAPTVLRELVLGLCIGLSAYVRSAFVLLVPAILLSRFLRRRALDPDGASLKSFALRRMTIFAATTCLVIAPWAIHKRATAPEPPADQTYQYTTHTLLWHVDTGDPSSPRVGMEEVLARIPVRLNEMVERMATLRLSVANLTAEPEPPLVRRILVVVFLASLLIHMVRRREPGELFLIPYVATLSLFPTEFLDRYILPIYLLAVPAAIELLRDVLRFLAGSRAAVGLSATALVVLAASHFEPRKDWKVVRNRHERFYKTCARLNSKLEPDARLCTLSGYQFCAALERPVYSMSFSIKRLGPSTGAEFVIDKYGLNTVIIDADHGPRRLMRYLNSRYPDVQTVRAAGARTHIYRVRD